MENTTPKPRRRVKKDVVASSTLEATPTGDDAVIAQLKDGKWKEVLEALGAEEYNRLRLLSLK